MQCHSMFQRFPSGCFTIKTSGTRLSRIYLRSLDQSLEKKSKYTHRKLKTWTEGMKLIFMVKKFQMTCISVQQQYWKVYSSNVTCWVIQMMIIGIFWCKAIVEIQRKYNDIIFGNDNLTCGESLNELKQQIID